MLVLVKLSRTLKFSFYAETKVINIVELDDDDDDDDDDDGGDIVNL